MSYEEKRVKVKDYGSLPVGSALLAPIPGVGGKAQKLHQLAAAAFGRMGEAVQRDLGLELAAASGWRRRRWGSWDQYVAFVTEKYGSLAEGRKWLAYASPHETGLAVDIGVGGLTPSRKTAAQQRETSLHKWLVEHAYEYGWHPYKREPWHWEFPVSTREWTTGELDPGHEDDEATEDEFEDEG